MNYSEYYNEVQAIASALVAEAMAYNDNDADEAMNDIMDYRLHEVIDSHQWVIYNGYNLDVIKHSNNSDYMVDNLGGADEILKNSGIDGLHQAMAFWAIYADVQELLNEKMDEYLENLDD